MSDSGPALEEWVGVDKTWGYWRCLCDLVTRGPGMDMEKGSLVGEGVERVQHFIRLWDEGPALPDLAESSIESEGPALPDITSRPW